MSDNDIWKAVTELRFSGVADRAAAQRLRQRWDQHPSAKRVRIDLRDCSDMGGEFVLALVDEVRQRGSGAVSLRLRNNAVRETVDMCGLDTLVGIELHD